MSGRRWRRDRVEKSDLVVARHVNHKIGSKLRGLAFAACGDRGVSAGTKSAVRKPPYDADPRTGARIEVFYVTAGSKRLAGAELVGSDRIASAALQLPYPPVSNELLRISRRDNQAAPSASRRGGASLKATQIENSCVVCFHTASANQATGSTRRKGGR